MLEKRLEGCEEVNMKISDLEEIPSLKKSYTKATRLKGLSYVEEKDRGQCAQNGMNRSEQSLGLIMQDLEGHCKTLNFTVL